MSELERVLAVAAAWRGIITALCPSARAAVPGVLKKYRAAFTLLIEAVSHTPSGGDHSNPVNVELVAKMALDIYGFVQERYPDVDTQSFTLAVLSTVQVLGDNDNDPHMFQKGKGKGVLI